MLGSETFKDAIHWIATTLETPAVVILIVAVVVVIIELGSLIVEIFFERIRARVDVTFLLVQMQGKNRAQLAALIDESRFLRHKKSALEEFVSAELSIHHSEALAVRLLSKEELRSTRILTVTDIIARIAPMFGLMATLIPLGPGLLALGQGDTQTLSMSLMTAFDATVTGLAAAGLAYIISRIRKRWYESDLVAMETVMEGIMDELFDGRPTLAERRAAGEMQIPPGRRGKRARKEKEKEKAEMAAALDKETRSAVPERQKQPARPAAPAQQSMSAKQAATPSTKAAAPAKQEAAPAKQVAVPAKQAAAPEKQADALAKQEAESVKPMAASAASAYETVPPVPDSASGAKPAPFATPVQQDAAPYAAPAPVAQQTQPEAAPYAQPVPTAAPEPQQPAPYAQPAQPGTPVKMPGQIPYAQPVYAQPAQDEPDPT
ncbi:MAG: MotA/TolQ/ExbB proton channel family protein [Clostridiales Family XIII bacterium]|jgi:biopolymer transport protein ExbB/TolQ|nr:MotA/TolQ/ExbB proton channel family protein [Clostridiales Family XIII bacterium]